MKRLDDTAVLLATAVFLFIVDWAVYKKHAGIGSSILLITLTIMLSYLAWIGSGIRDTAMLGYCGVLVFAAMLGSKRLLLGIMAVILGVCLLITQSNYAGWHIHHVEPTNIYTGFIVIVVLGVIGYSVWLMAHDYREALNELERENKEVTDAKIHIEYLAMHDPLTNLPNRNMAQEHFTISYDNVQKANRPLSIIFIDLDNLKPINDSLGHQAGDQILKEVARRLVQIAGDENKVCRYGGDEFILILQNIHTEEDASAISLAILHMISQPFTIKGIEISCTCSIGIAMAPRDGIELDTLIKKADIAMYQSKDSGRNSFRFFDHKANPNLPEHLNLATGMRKALTDHQFSLYYQPKIDLRSQTLTGFEALLRWEHPQYGFIPPATFIPLAESSGAIIQLGDWVINEACRQGKIWLDAGIKDFSIAVNVSSIQFKRGTIDSVILNALQKTCFPAHMLELELTESILIEDSDRLAITLATLRNLGVHFSIDDFGTGYSNLGYLKKFEVEFLKIDQSFVRRMEEFPEDAVIVNAIIQLANSLGLETIAEGVETDSIAAMLRAQGCKMAQGYLWARPLPAKDVENFWRTWQEQHPQ
jgi:diguanylate cyclase (GGDEF)-like protein